MSKKSPPASDLPPVGPIRSTLGSRVSFPNTKPEEVKLVRPDQPSRCTWSPSRPPTDSPHTRVTGVRSVGIQPDILSCIGHTPLVRINKISQDAGLQCQLLGKCEFLNPGGSVKDRIGLRMVEEAERAGILKQGDTIIEPTSGNTGIGLALMAAVRGYRCIIVLPERMSNEKVMTLKSLGAEIVRTPSAVHWTHPDSLISVAQRLLKEIPNSIILDQYRNPGNPLAHYDTTAEEILAQCGGQVDMVVLGTGTGGTATGIGRKLKEKCPTCQIIGVDPEGSLMAQPDSLNPRQFQPYELEGTGYDFIPTTLDRSVVDTWMKVSDTEAFIMARRLIREEGLMCGGSGGASMACAVKAAARLQVGQKCVVILPDGIRNYMTKFLDDNWLASRNMIQIQVDEKGQWWEGEEVRSLNISAPHTILPNITIDTAIEIMSSEKFDQLPVVSKEGTVAGVVKLANIKSKLLAGKVSLSDPVEKVKSKVFKRVTLDTQLGVLNRLLESENFALVVNTQTIYSDESEEEKETVVGIVTDIDLLHFISSRQEKLDQ